MSMGQIIGTPIFFVNRNTDHRHTDNIGMSIGSRIREARKLRRMSQKVLAAKVGIKQSTLSELETGESGGTTYIARFAAALRVQALWLETGRGPREAVDEDLLTPGGESTGFLEIKAETAAELQILSIYRLANEREREAIDNAVQYVRGLIERGAPR